MKILDDYEKVKLITHIFMTHNLTKPNNSVNLQKFVRDVQQTFKDRGHFFSEKEILTTWKELLEEYYYYKENCSTDDAKQAWYLFSLMDNCFDQHTTSEKFTSELTFFLIDRMSNHKETLAKQGLTQEVLDSIEQEFNQLGNNEINQRDIYTRWEHLKQSYRENRNLMKQRRKNLQFSEFFEAMRLFYQSPEFHVVRPYHSPLKRRIMGEEQSRTSSKRINDAISFNSSMRYKLLTCIKNKKTQLSFNKELSPVLLNYIVEEFKKINLDVTAESICNEWNDLIYRYELMKSDNSSHHWKYFNDVRNICHSTESVVVENIETNPVSEMIDDSVLEKYTKKISDIPELRDLMFENNLSGTEVNYLLDLNET